MTPTARPSRRAQCARNALDLIDNGLFLTQLAYTTSSRLFAVGRFRLLARGA